MKITKEVIPLSKEEEILLRLHQFTPQIEEFLEKIESKDYQILASKDNRYLWLKKEDIYYFDAVDDRVYLYARKEVYSVKKKLYELEEELPSSFLRCSKAQIVNLDKIKKFAPAFSGRFEAWLDNEEKIIISRQYVPQLKKKLGLDK